MVSKVVRGSAITFIGNIIFRFGGWIYRFILATVLGPSAYGIFGLTTPFQGIFQTLSSGVCLRLLQNIYLNIIYWIKKNVPAR